MIYICAQPDPGVGAAHEVGKHQWRIFTCEYQGISFVRYVDAVVWDLQANRDYRLMLLGPCKVELSYPLN